MKNFYNTINITIKGPFLTSSGINENYFYDKTFQRDSAGNPIIPKSHIKGKIRMALEELYSIDHEKLNSYKEEYPIDLLFGKPSEEGSYDPVYGILKFSSLRLDSPSSEINESGYRTQTTIDVVTMTAAKNQLRTIEDLFGINKESCWQGEIEYCVENEKQAKRLTELIFLALKWLPNLGAQKGTGFGRNEKIHITSPNKISCASDDSDKITELQNKANESDQFIISIYPLEPITIGGVKSRKSNFIDSEVIITGGLIKGAFAACLNRGLNIRPSYQELSEKTKESYQGFENLVSNFDKIRFLHAIPSYNQNIRPIKIPISTVKVNNQKYDLALTPIKTIDTISPTYFSDWKIFESYFDEAHPNKIISTNVEIDDNSRRSKEGNLFSKVAFEPKDGEREIYWIGKVDFSGIEDKQQKKLAKQEFIEAVYLYFIRLAKRNTKAKVELSLINKPDDFNQAAINHNQLVIALQSDAIMLNPETIKKNNAIKLFDAYAAYWKEQFGELSEIIIMKDFYASQKFYGGYLYHRYLGKYDRKSTPKQYRPYFLTEAGSTFIFEINGNHKKIEQLTQKLLSSGLCLPNWTKNNYILEEVENWKTCPFVPANGYGEVNINLKTHWEKCPEFKEEIK